MKINFKGMVDSALKFGKEYKPEIATGTGIFLMVAGAVGCVVATVKTMHAVADKKEEILVDIASDAEEYEALTEEEQEQYDYIVEHPLPISIVFPVIWKYWVAPVASEIGGACCLIFSNRESARRIGLLTTTLASQVIEAKDYKEAAKEILGEEKEHEIERAQEKRRAERDYDDGPKNVIDTGTGSQLWKDYYTANLWIKASPAYMESCRNEFNEMILNRRDRSSFGDEYVTLSDWYDILSLEIDHSSFSDTFGFNVNDGIVEFSASYNDTGITREGYSYRLIRFRNAPNYLPFV